MWEREAFGCAPTAPPECLCVRQASFFAGRGTPSNQSAQSASLSTACACTGNHRRLGCAVDSPVRTATSAQRLVRSSLGLAGRLRAAKAGPASIDAGAVPSRAVRRWLACGSPRFLFLSGREIQDFGYPSPSPVSVESDTYEDLSVQNRTTKRLTGTRLQTKALSCRMRTVVVKEPNSCQQPGSYPRTARQPGAHGSRHARHALLIRREREGRQQKK